MTIITALKEYTNLGFGQTLEGGRGLVDFIVPNPLNPIQGITVGRQQQMSWRNPKFFPRTKIAITGPILKIFAIFFLEGASLCGVL